MQWNEKWFNENSTSNVKCHELNSNLRILHMKQLSVKFILTTFRFESIARIRALIKWDNQIGTKREPNPSNLIESIDGVLPQIFWK